MSLDGIPAYLWRKPDLAVPNIRKLLAEGSTADAMTETSPANTWSSHTSMITGRSPQAHGVLYLGELNLPGPNQPPVVYQWADKEKYVRVPTLYDVAFDAGLTTAESDWVAITNAPKITWAFPEIPRVEGKVEQEMMAAGIITEEQIGWMQHRPGRKALVWHDEMWTKAACFMFKEHQPNLLLYHMLSIDWNHHYYGVGTEASHAAIAYADRLVGDIVQTVDESGLRDKTTFIIVSDHGFKKVTRYINLNVALKLAGLARANGPNLVECAAAVMSLGGVGCVYVTDPTRKAELLPKLRKMFGDVEGIARIIDGKEGPTVGMPSPEDDPRMGDLILFAKEGYLFNNSAEGEDEVTPVVNYSSTHGYLASDPDMDGIFIATGAGIKKGVQLPRISSLDLAPTIAHLLGITMLEPEGRVIEEILL
jgi:predicted AlkP superfamily pyrophosphatase or phosphodiesterase